MSLKEEFGCRVSRAQVKLLDELETEGYLGETDGVPEYDLVEVHEFESRTVRALREKNLIDLYTQDPDQPEDMYGEARLKPSTGAVIRRLRAASADNNWVKR